MPKRKIFMPDERAIIRAGHRGAKAKSVNKEAAKIKASVNKHAILNDDTCVLTITIFSPVPCEAYMYLKRVGLHSDGTSLTRIEISGWRDLSTLTESGPYAFTEEVRIPQGEYTFSINSLPMLPVHSTVDCTISGRSLRIQLDYDNNTRPPT